jgi:O-antigen/teichoic acid export membrane protein
MTVGMWWMASARNNNRLTKNIAANLSRLGAGWLVLLLMPPILVRSLDSSSYATWMLILQLGAYATLFEAALQMATARFVAYAEGLNDRKLMGDMIGSSAVLLTAMGSLVLLAITITCWKLGTFFPSIPKGILPQAQPALMITAASLAVCLPCSALAGMYIGLQRNEVPALVGGAARLFGAAGATWSAKHQQGLIAMALWTAAGTLLQPMLYLLIPGRSEWRPFLKLAHIGKKSIIEFGRFCSATLVSQFGTLLISGLDLPIVAAFDFPSLAYYSVAATFSNMLVVPYGAIVSTIMPLAAGIVGEDAKERRGAALIRSSHIANALLCLMAMPIMLGMHSFLSLWVGRNYANHALTIGLVLVGAQTVRLVLVPYALLGFSAGQQSRMLVSPCAEGLVNLLLSLVLVRWMGAMGVAIGTLFGAVVGIAIHFTVSMPRTDSIVFSRSKLMRQTILSPAFYTLPIAAAAFLILRFTSSNAQEYLLLAIAEIGLGCAFWRFYLAPEERSSVRALVGRRIMLKETAEA